MFLSAAFPSRSPQADLPARLLSAISSPGGALFNFSSPAWAAKRPGWGAKLMALYTSTPAF